MNCPNCGKTLKKTAKECDECGLKIEKLKKTTPEVDNKNVILRIFVALAILLIVIVVSVVFVITNVKDKKDSKKEEQPVIEDANEIAFLGYTLVIPEGFRYDNNNGLSYIQGDEFYTMFVEYPLSYNEIVSHKEIFIKALEDEGYTINSYNTKKVNGKDYFLVNGEHDNVSFGYLLGDFDNDNHFCFTIVSSELNSFNEGWYDIVISFIETARK